MSFFEMDFDWAVAAFYKLVSPEEWPEVYLQIMETSDALHLANWDETKPMSENGDTLSKEDMREFRQANPGV